MAVPGAALSPLGRPERGGRILPSLRTLFGLGGSELDTRFRKGDPRASEAGRKGGQVIAAKKRRLKGPFTGTILDVMDAAGLTGPSWTPWRVFWKSVFGLSMAQSELLIFQRHTAREEPPKTPFRESWMPIGRRGGKSRNAAIAALFLAIRFDASRLAPGELAVIPVLAADRRQARQVLGYLRGLLELPEFKPCHHRMLREAVELNNRINIEIHTASYRTTRGYTCVGVICDEISFWRTDDGAANPDVEVLAALRPGLATVPDSLLLALSSPYASRGELFKAVERSFGKDDSHVLVWNADSRSMNSELPASVVERAFQDDPVSASSEYGRDGRVSFRRDVEAYLDPVSIQAVTVLGRRELPPHPGVEDVAFVDPSGGSVDSFTVAIAHLDGEVAVLDALRERKPPFNSDSVVEEFANLLHSYRCTRVEGDRYGGQWPRERFERQSIKYIPSERTKSDIYRELVAPVNAGRIELLDNSVLRTQLLGLERRTARGGRDSVDHGPGGRDDLTNSAAGALLLALPAARKRKKLQWA